MRHAVAEIYSGGTPDTSDSRYWADDDSGVAWVAIGDMTRADTVTRTDKRVTADGVADKRLRVLPAGTLLYSMYASLGKVAVLGIDATINQAILGLVPDTTRLRGDFLRYWLVSMEQHLPLFSSSNTQDNLNAAKVRSFPVFVPSLDEQRAIASFLDRETAKIDALVEEQERLMALLRQKRQAVISQAVTKGLNPDAPMKASEIEWLGDVPAHWSVVRLKNLLSAPLQYGANEAADEDNPTYPRFIRITDITEAGSLRDDTFRSLPPEIAQPYLLDDGDVLLARSGATVGKSFIYAGSTGPACFAGYLIRARFSRQLCRPRWFELYAQTPGYWHAIFGTQIQATIPNVSAEKYASLWLPIPSVQEQDAIIHELDAELDQFAQLTSGAERAVELLLERRAALISAAVTGQIDVRNLDPTNTECSPAAQFKCPP